MGAFTMAPPCSPASSSAADRGTHRESPQRGLFSISGRRSEVASVRERAEEAGGLPRFIEREFEEYLRCGVLEWGCLHLVCRSCGHSQIVALSCKRRGFCPSCLGRRMADTAVHLEQRVLPAVPIRHWIGSLPWGVRALLGY